MPTPEPAGATTGEAPDDPRIAVVICTHNRAGLLLDTLNSLAACTPFSGPPIEVMVVANHCSDDTSARVRTFTERLRRGDLRVCLIEEARAGKSYALNRALTETRAGVLCFIDDDQTVHPGFLAALVDGLNQHPDDTLFCGRIWPAWDGSEPRWVHAKAPYRVPIRPFPEFDPGESSFQLPPDARLPSGGNLAVRREVFAQIGGFSTRLGPTGHNLVGGEDHDFLCRALNAGHRIRYLPQMRQRHAVLHDRLTLGYTLRKSFLRSRASHQIRANQPQPRAYMVRKLAGCAVRAIGTFNRDRRFFYLIRTAASAGELSAALAGWWQAQATRALLPVGWLRAGLLLLLLTMTGALTTLSHALGPDGANHYALLPALGVAASLSLLLLARSLLTFTQTGPQLRAEVLRHYRTHSILAVSRLTLAAFLIVLLQALAGSLAYETLCVLRGLPADPLARAMAATLGVLLISGLQFCRHLLYLPASIAASSHYRLSRLIPLWQRLTPGRLRAATFVLTAPWLTLWAALGLVLPAHPAHAVAMPAWLLATASGAVVAWLLRSRRYPAARKRPEQASETAAAGTRRPNILMIGCDTLRADRINARHSPFLHQWSQRAHAFANCYVPCARTAPSLVSLLTGVLPHHHGIRDNYIGDDQTTLPMDSLPALLRRHGYRTAAVSDWCGSDLGKFNFGFDELDLPEDQWNLRFFIRQGPKDLRLFLSLFVHNDLGKALLPEVHYLGGVPMTDRLGVDAARMISRLAHKDAPFFLNVFFSTTHPPFGCEYPYYQQHSSSTYRGESKFAMARLTDPWEILRRQAEPREAFDLNQIISLYDGCVTRFDDEVARLMTHLTRCGLDQDTMVVIYSDHGMEFFEHGSWGQGNSAIGDHSSRIPLIIRTPDQTQGRQHDGVVRSIDITPTLLDLLGLPLPTGIDGVSLKSRLDGHDPVAELEAYNETGIWMTDIPGLPARHLRYPDLLELLEIPDHATGTLAVKPTYLPRIIAAKDRMLRKGRWKLVCQPLVDGCRLRLFDLEHDPECIYDVADAHPDEVAALWQRLKRILDEDLGERSRAQVLPSADECPEATPDPALTGASA